jgi:insulysin
MQRYINLTKYYSANMMNVVILGKEPLDQLEQMARDKFSPIIDKNVAAPVFPGHPLTPLELQKQIFVKPIKETKMLKLTFPVPDMQKHYKSQPFQYASHLIGHEGRGSVLSYLKLKGWAQGLSAGASGGSDGF